MEKKRSRGVTLFGISLLYFPIASIANFIYVCFQSFRLAGVVKDPYFMLKVFYGSYVSELRLLLSILMILVIVGIFKLRKWARYALIIIASLFIISDLISLLRYFRFYRLGNIVKSLFSAGVLIMYGYFLGLIYFFTRPKVKGQFKS